MQYCTLSENTRYRTKGWCGNAIVQDTCSAHIVPVHNRTGFTFGPNAPLVLCTIACDAHSDRKHIRTGCTSKYIRTLTWTTHSYGMHIQIGYVFGLYAYLGRRIFTLATWSIQLAFIVPARRPGPILRPFLWRSGPPCRPSVPSVRRPLLRRAHSRDVFVGTARGVRLSNGVLSAEELRRPRH